jgi:hypothetical protein
MEDGIKNLMDIMTRARVQYQEQMNVMLELQGRRDNGTFTKREMRNRLDQGHTMSLFLLAFFGRLQVPSSMVLQPWCIAY